MAGQQFRQALNSKLSGSDTIAPQIVHLQVAQLPSVTNGQMYFVTDAAPGTPCTAGGSGALAWGVNGVWSCGALPGGPAAPTSVSCSHHVAPVGSGTFNAGATNNSGSFTTPASSTDSDNCTVTFSVPAPAARMCIWSVMNQDGSASSAGVPDVTTTTTAKVDFASAGGTASGTGVLTIGYTCF